MASVLLAAGTKGKRSILPHSRVMIHQPMGGAEGQASDIEITAREILKLKAELYDILVEHTGKSLEDITRDADRDFWMSAQEALDYGMVDEIIKRKK
jgi:ATP-dependent Clp protease protease subunit